MKHRLSEHAARGFESTLPGFDTFFEGVEHDDNGVPSRYEACYLGAAFIGAGYTVPAFNRLMASPEFTTGDEFPILNQRLLLDDLPEPVKEWGAAAAGGCYLQLKETIWYMNDVLKWSREKINEWVKQIEEKYE